MNNSLSSQASSEAAPIFASVDSGPDGPLPIGCVIDVRTRYLGHWSGGFHVAERVGGGCRIRRSSDGSVFADVFPWSDVRPASSHRNVA
jgi:hypothetical protein